MITISPHPLLDAQAFVTQFSAPLGEIATSDVIRALLTRGVSAPFTAGPPAPFSSAAPAPFTIAAPAPFTTDDALRKAIRDLLRQGGYKPTGRGKPASEYLLGAAAEAPLASINAAVDACNAVSLHSGLPISVIDLDRARAPFSIAVAGESAHYVFNAAGQTIELAGLVCLFDADGPCANAVKDAQRTKTSSDTRRTLSVVWGTNALPGRARDVMEWYRALLGELGARTDPAL